MALSYDIPYMWNVKRNDTNELIYKTERRLTDLDNRLMVAGRKLRGRDSWGVWDRHVHRWIADKDYCIAHDILFNALWWLDGKGV